MQSLAENIFGSTDAADFMNNQAAVATSYSTAWGTCATALNAVNTEAATTQVINGLLFNAKDRFSLAYTGVADGGNATTSVIKRCVATGASGATREVNVILTSSTVILSILPTSTAPSGTFILGENVEFRDPYGKTALDLNISSIDATELAALNTAADTTTNLASGGNVNKVTMLSGTYTQVPVVATTGAGALCTVIMASTTAAKSVYVTTVATTTPYVKDETLTFTNGAGAAVDMTNTTTNSVMAAMLNGTLDSAAVEAPLEATDVIKAVYTITPHADQEDASGAANLKPSTWLVSFTVPS